MMKVGIISGRIHELELAVVRAAMRDHDLSPGLASAIEALTFGCPECNAGGHTCPGDGEPIEHGRTVCREHEADADAWRDAKHTPLAAEVAELVLGTATEWCRLPFLGTEEEQHQVRFSWQGAPGRVIVESIDHDYIGEFQVTVSAVQLPPPPPLGPEDDGALRAELTTAGQQPKYEYIWHPRTWADVRPGDTVRMPGTESTACVNSAILINWHVDPRTGTSSFNPPVRLDHAVMRVRFAHENFPRDMDPAKPIEIELTASEVAALDAAGWHNRAGLERFTHDPESDADR